MLPITKAFKTTVLAAGRENIDCYLVIGGTRINRENIKSFSIEWSLGISDMIGIGSAPSQKLSISLYRQGNVPDYYRSNSKITAYIGLYVPKGGQWKHEYIKVGSFRIPNAEDITKNDKVISMDCYDRMADMTEIEVDFNNEEVPSGTVEEVCRWIERKANIRFLDIPDGTVPNSPAGHNIREVIQELAFITGTNCIVDRDEYFRFRKPTAVPIDEFRISANNLTKFNLAADQDTKVARIKVHELNYTKWNDELDEKNHTWAYDAEGIDDDSAATGVEFSTSLIHSEEDVKKVFDLAQMPYEYFNYEAECQGMPHIEVGDIIQFVTRSGNKYDMIINSHKMVYDGGLKSYFNAKGKDKSYFTTGNILYWDTSDKDKDPDTDSGSGKDYVLPIAGVGEDGILGGIKVGENLEIDPKTGVLNAIIPEDSGGSGSLDGYNLGYGLKYFNKKYIYSQEPWESRAGTVTLVPGANYDRSDTLSHAGWRMYLSSMTNIYADSLTNIETKQGVYYTGAEYVDSTTTNRDYSRRFIFTRTNGNPNVDDVSEDSYGKFANSEIDISARVSYAYMNKDQTWGNNFARVIIGSTTDYTQTFLGGSSDHYLLTYSIARKYYEDLHTSDYSTSSDNEKHDSNNGHGGFVNIYSPELIEIGRTLGSATNQSTSGRNQYPTSLPNDFSFRRPYWNAHISRYIRFTASRYIWLSVASTYGAVVIDTPIYRPINNQSIDNFNYVSSYSSMEDNVYGELFDQLKPIVYYNYASTYSPSAKNQPHFGGFLASDIEKAEASLGLSTNDYALTKTLHGGYKAVSLEMIIPLLVREVQILKGTVAPGTPSDTSGLPIKRFITPLSYNSNTGEVSIRTASTGGIDGVASFNSNDFTVSSGIVSLKNSSSGSSYKFDETFIKVNTLTSPNTVSFVKGHLLKKLTEVPLRSSGDFTTFYKNYFDSDNDSDYKKLLIDRSYFLGTYFASSNAPNQGILTVRPLINNGALSVGNRGKVTSVVGVPVAYDNSQFKAINFGINSGSSLTSDQYWACQSNGNGEINANTSWASTALCGMLSLTSSASDIRVKKDISDLSNSFSSFIDKLRPVIFTYNREGYSNNGKRDVGLIAQEVEEAIEETDLEDFGLIDEDDEGIKGIWYQKFIPILIKEVQELKKVNKSLQKQVSILQEQLNK